MGDGQRVAIVTLGCARNDVDSDELAGRLITGGWSVVDQQDAADVVLVNTCGFIDAAKQESISAVLDLADRPEAPPVVAVGCLAQRYGADLADELPEAAAVLGFDAYPDIARTLARVVSGEVLPAHTPVDRRTLLPISPVHRQGSGTAVPGHGVGPAESSRTRDPLLATAIRHRLARGPVAPLKIASGCDRRCSFCAIPAFRGAFVSRPVADVVAEAAALVADGVRGVVLVSENSTSYGKDLPGQDLPTLLTALGEVAGLARVQVSYLQPAEIRPDLITAMTALPHVADHFDISFQHASGPLLRSMRRFGDAERFLDLIASIRAAAPAAGIRSNVIVGFPGETEADVATLADFLSAAELDAVGVFGYSDEEGTAAADLAGKIDPDEIAARVAELTDLVQVVSAERAAARVGSVASVLVESVTDGRAIGKASFQGSDDGSTILRASRDVLVGDVVDVAIVGSVGVDLFGAGVEADR